MKLEIRSNNSATLTGYVNVSNRDSRVIKDNGKTFVEQVENGVFTRALENAEDICLLENHNNNHTYGSTGDGTVKLKEDNVGLFAQLEITDPNMIQKARNNEYRGWSFGMSVNKDVWENTNKDGIERRCIKDLNLYEISLIDSKMLPVYSGTSIIETRADKIEYRAFEELTLEDLQPQSLQEGDSLLEHIPQIETNETNDNTEDVTIKTEDKVESMEVITTMDKDGNVTIDETKMELVKRKIQILKLKGVQF